ncbi:MAG: ATP-binding cassette domain-containing protein [Planctomycetota bacterium]
MQEAFSRVCALVDAASLCAAECTLRLESSARWKRALEHPQLSTVTNPEELDTRVEELKRTLSTAQDATREATRALSEAIACKKTAARVDVLRSRKRQCLESANGDRVWQESFARSLSSVVHTTHWNATMPELLTVEFTDVPQLRTEVRAMQDALHTPGETATLCTQLEDELNTLDTSLSVNNVQKRIDAAKCDRDANQHTVRHTRDVLTAYNTAISAHCTWMRAREQCDLSTVVHAWTNLVTWMKERCEKFDDACILQAEDDTTAMCALKWSEYAPQMKEAQQHMSTVEDATVRRSAMKEFSEQDASMARNALILAETEQHAWKEMYTTLQTMHVSRVTSAKLQALSSACTRVHDDIKSIQVRLSQLRKTRLSTTHVEVYDEEELHMQAVSKEEVHDQLQRAQRNVNQLVDERSALETTLHEMGIPLTSTGVQDMDMDMNMDMGMSMREHMAQCDRDHTEATQWIRTVVDYEHAEDVRRQHQVEKETLRNRMDESVECAHTMDACKDADTLMRRIYTDCLVDTVESLEKLVNGFLSPVTEFDMYVELLFSHEDARKKNVSSRQTFVTRIMLDGMDVKRGQLSQGQYQLLDVAFTLALSTMMHAPVVFLDEVCANFSESLIEDFFKMLAPVRKTTLVMFACHKLEGGSYFDATVDVTQPHA